MAAQRLFRPSRLVSQICLCLAVFSMLFGATARTASADVLIGMYNVSYLNNASGCFQSDGNPFNCSYESGPITVNPALTPPGYYRVEIIRQLDPNNIVGGIAVWDGDSTAGTKYRVGATFHHTSGQIYLYAHDWYPFDNPPASGWVMAVYSTSALCDLEPSKPTYVNGDTLAASPFRLANFTDTPLTIELKAWLTLPNGAKVGLINAGANGSVVLPAGLDANLGPLSLFGVTAGFPRGAYTLGCRVLDPVTGEIFGSAEPTFEIQ